MKLGGYMIARHSILIVDDDESICRTLALVLGKKGYETEIARTGRDALNKAKKRFFHVVLLDLKLPGMQGLSLLAPLKKQHPDLATIVITGYASLETAVQAVNEGAAGYITKPLDMDETLTIIGEALEKQRLIAELRRLSLSDELTGLLNRRGFIRMAQHQLKLANRTKRQVLLLFADFDRLKQINDALGHRDGDRALIEFANVLTKTFRESDIIARIGGDEFVVLAVEAGEDRAETLLHRFWEKLDAHNAQGEQHYKLSISVGIAHYDPERPCSIEELLHRADAAMYEQKKAEQAS